MTTNIRDNLIKFSGMSTEEINQASKVKQDQDFEMIIETLKEIHRAKGVLYGNYIETHGCDPELLALTEHYADVKRKFVRADNYMKQRHNGKDLSPTLLIDTYMDMAVYSILGIQLAMEKAERREWSKT